MIIYKYLTINSRGVVKVTEKEPRSLSSNEVSVVLSIRLPDGLFKRPRIKAEVEISNDVVLPNVLSAQVLIDAKEAIKAATGLDFDLKVVEPITDKLEDLVK